MKKEFVDTLGCLVDLGEQPLQVAVNGLQRNADAPLGLMRHLAVETQPASLAGNSDTEDELYFVVFLEHLICGIDIHAVAADVSGHAALPTRLVAVITHGDLAGFAVVFPSRGGIIYPRVRACSDTGCGRRKGELEIQRPDGEHGAFLKTSPADRFATDVNMVAGFVVFDIVVAEAGSDYPGVKARYHSIPKGQVVAFMSA